MKKELKIGLFFLISFLIFAYFIVKTNAIANFILAGKTYPLYAKFSTVSGLLNNAPVRLAGIKIGFVEKIYLEGNKAVVKMRIKNKYKLTSDARAKVSSVGIVGEKFLEIVYLDDYKSINPVLIEPNGELKTILPFDIDAISEKLNAITTKVSIFLDSVNKLFKDDDLHTSIISSLKNIDDLTMNIKNLTAENSNLYKTLENLNKMSVKLNKLSIRLNSMFESLDKSLIKENDSVFNKLKTISKNVEKMSVDLKSLIDDINKGKGTAGKLLKEDSLYKDIDKTVKDVKSIVSDIKSKTESLTKSELSYRVGLDYFYDNNKSRINLGVFFNLNNMNIIAKVKEDELSGDPYFSILAGKKFGNITFAAGMVDSGLGAGVYVDFLRKRLILELEAFDFYRESYPNVKTTLYFSPIKNIYFSAGFEDVFSQEARKFLFGISFSN